MLALLTKARLEHVVENHADATHAPLVELDLLQVRCGVAKPLGEPQSCCQKCASRPSCKAQSTVSEFA